MLLNNDLFVSFHVFVFVDFLTFVYFSTNTG